MEWLQGLRVTKKNSNMDLKKVVLTTSYDFGYWMFSLLEKGYILLQVDFVKMKLSKLHHGGMMKVKTKMCYMDGLYRAIALRSLIMGSFLSNHMICLFLVKRHVTLSDL